MTRTYLLIAALLAGCAAPAPPPEPMSVVADDPVQVELDRRRAAAVQRAATRLLQRKARARAVLPDGVRDMGLAPSADYRGTYAAMWSALLGEGHSGALLVVLDSATTPDQGRGSVVELPATLAGCLEQDGTMGRLIQEEPVVVVDLVPARGRGRHPMVLRIQVLDPAR